MPQESSQNNHLKLPEFPANRLGLKRGSVLEAIDNAVKGLGLEPGDRIPIGYDGKHVRCCSLTWSIEKLLNEIEEQCFWKIDGDEIDLSDPVFSLQFAQDIEHLFRN